MQHIAIISSKGQITLPASIRRSLNLHEGDKITIVKRHGSIEIKPDTYQQELNDLRARAKAHMQRNGTWGMSWEEVRKRADEAKLKEYQEKYGPSA